MKLSKYKEPVYYMSIESKIAFDKAIENYISTTFKIKSIIDNPYKGWYNKIIWHKDYVILLGGKRLPKQGYITHNGFNTIGFNRLLKSIYESNESI